MKCNCGFEGQRANFGKIGFSGESRTILKMPGNKHVGAVDLYACPKCGAIYTEARGAIANTSK